MCLRSNDSILSIFVNWTLVFSCLYIASGENEDVVLRHDHHNQIIEEHCFLENESKETMKRKIFFILQLQVMFMTTSSAVCPFALDLAFLLDASGSIGSDNYRNVKKFINELIEHFQVSTAGTHVGVVSFSDSAKTEIPFTARQNMEEIRKSVLNIRYYAKTTRIDLALQTSRRELFSVKRGMRSNVPHVLLAITDGISSSGEYTTKRESQRLKDDGIVIFALGLGSSVNSAEMKALASDPSHVFRYTSVRQMLPADNGLKIALALCSVGRTSNAFVLPVATQRSLENHIIASRTTYDDLECAFMCITHSSCYSFNFHKPARRCGLSYAKRSDFPGDFIIDRDSVYSELKFERKTNAR